MNEGCKLLSGAESIALSAIQLGVKFVTSYPGTPATSIFTALFKFSPENISLNWSVNEKVALEEAAGAAMLGERSLCIMKHYGLNVCSDFLGAISLGDYLPGGLVIIVGDDPEGHASRSEQDSRHYGKLFNIPVLELITSINHMQQLNYAYEISSKFNVPVLLRTSTRLLDTYLSYRSSIKNNISEKPLKISSIPKAIFSSPAPVYHAKLLEKNRKIVQYYEEIISNSFYADKEKELLIIATGRGAILLEELIVSHNLGIRVDVLPLMTIIPFPGELLSNICRKYKKIAVIEEGDELVENEIHIALSESKNIKFVAGKRNKLFTGQFVSRTGELNIDIIKRELLTLLGINHNIEVEQQKRSKHKIRGLLCPGCPHSGSLFALREVKRELHENITIIGDVGCYTMGIGDAGYNVFDTVMCMGASISLASGMQQVYIKNNISKRTIAVIGDSTFFHSGIAPLLQVFKRNIPIIVIILDNKTTAMTGGQNTISSSDINLIEMIKGFGIIVSELSPYDVPNNVKLIKASLHKQELKVFILSAPCALHFKRDNRIYYEVDENRCLGFICMQKDCLDGFKCSAISLNNKNEKVKIDLLACIGCGTCSKLCNHGAIIQKITNK